MSIAELESSPFLADIDRVRGAGPVLRRIGWIVITALCGLVAGMILTALAVLVIMIAYLFTQMGSGASPSDISQAIQRLVDPTAAPTYASSLIVLAVVAVANSCLFGGFVATATLMNRQKLKAGLTAAPRFRGRMLLVGLALFIVALGPVIAIEVALTPESAAFPLFTLAHTLPQRLGYVAISVVALVIAAGAEEVLCRGWLMRHTAAFTRNVWILLAVNGVLFSALHFPDVDPNAFIGRALMGMGFCYIVLRTGGIELAIGAHAANNILLLLFVQTLPLTPPPPEPLSPLSNVSTLVGVALYVGVTELIMRWEPLRRWTHAEVDRTPREALAF